MTVLSLLIPGRLVSGATLALVMAMAMARQSTYRDDLDGDTAPAEAVNRTARTCEVDEGHAPEAD
ncbi:hypothetical protein [Streptomyces regalis]|uniref:hypothetical protein n=1 Tax=Streptomyces regalis TaxID=68262 RepID=UPI000A9B6FA9|nr:hypothetical protein [Streptomyces regalis]